MGAAMDKTATARDRIAGNAILMAILPTTYTANSSMEAASADYGGQTYATKSKTGALCALARALMDAGCPDVAWQAARDGVVVLSGTSLHRLAGWAYSDTEKGLVRAKWAPFAMAMVE